MRSETAAAASSTRCNVLLVAPRFTGMSFWNLTETCKVFGARTPAPPTGLITVAAMLPAHWECRLVNRNTEELTGGDLDWADMVMTGGMMPQRPDTLEVIALAKTHGKPVVVGGPDITSSPEAYEAADFRVLGEAEGILDRFIAAWEAGERGGTFEAEKFKADVTKTPIPRWDLLKRDQYMYYGVQFARGCPFTCEFCDIIELYGRAPRAKTAAQLLAELDRLYALGYRGHLDFVDDNFIGNKKAVKAFLPHLIEWQKAHGYPFELSTEASVNLADDAALLQLMREANFFTIFVGIESPDPETLVHTQKKQNTRRSLVDSIHTIYRAGMSVNAGFILGFDSEKGSVAEAMIELIEGTAIPVATVGLLFALPGTQLTRRLAAEGRLLPPEFLKQFDELDQGDHCAMGLNFHTARPRRDILCDLKAVQQRLYSIDGYFGRVAKLLSILDRPHQDRRRSQEFLRRNFGTSGRELRMVGRLFWRVLRYQPEAFGALCRNFFGMLWRNPDNINSVVLTASFYLHLGPFVRQVIAGLERRIAAIPEDGDGLEVFDDTKAPARLPTPEPALALAS